MSKSDFFVIITIALAIVTLFSERNRKFYLLKFSKVEWFGIALLFIGVHLLVWSEEWTIWRGTIVDIPSCPFPTTWAYFLFIFILSYIVYKLWRGKFPQCNYERLFHEYLNLLAIKDISYLSKLIKEKHFSTIIEYYERLLKLKDKYENKDYLNGLNKLQLNDKNNKFASQIIEQIIRNEDFISSVVDFNPIYFCPLIKYQVETDEVFLNTILKYLIKKKNIQFFKEVNKAVKCDFIFGNPLNRSKYPIVYSFLENVKIASSNFIWQSVGEEALLELREEMIKNPSYLRTEMPDNDYSKNSLFSNSKIFVAINFFDIMESSYLLQDSESDDWILYYSFFTEYLLKNLKNGNQQNNHKTCAYYLIKEMVIHLGGDLLSLAKRKQNEVHKRLIINCMNEMKRHIEDTKKLNSFGKTELLEGLLV